MPAETPIGFVGGGGLELRAGILKVAPEFRFIRWKEPFWESYGSRSFTRSNRNEAAFLLGLSF
jgi:hypothetical protein